MNWPAKTSLPLNAAIPLTQVILASHHTIKWL